MCVQIVAKISLINLMSRISSFFCCVKTYRCATWLNFHYTQKGFPKGSKRHKIFTLLAMYLRKSEFYVHIMSPKTLLRFFLQTIPRHRIKHAQCNQACQFLSSWIVGIIIHNISLVSFICLLLSTKNHFTARECTHCIYASVSVCSVFEGEPHFYYEEERMVDSAFDAVYKTRISCGCIFIANKQKCVFSKKRNT